jgi:hypothetical protein
MNYEERSESNASTKVSCTKRCDTEAELVPGYLELRYAVEYGLVNTVACVYIV